MTKQHKPTDRARGLVEGMALTGIPQHKIAQALGLDAKTLRKRYSNELDCAGAIRLGEVTQNLFRIASTGKGAAAVSAGKFILNMQAGWSSLQMSDAMDDLDLTDDVMMTMTDEELYCTARGQPLPRASKNRIRSEKRKPRRDSLH